MNGDCAEWIMSRQKGWILCFFHRCAPRVEFYVNPTSLAEKYAGCSMALSRFRIVSSMAYRMQWIGNTINKAVALSIHTSFFLTPRAPSALPLFTTQPKKYLIYHVCWNGNVPGLCAILWLVSNQFKCLTCVNSDFGRLMFIISFLTYLSAWE